MNTDKRPLIEKIYQLVCEQPGYTADQYLTSLKASIRSGGCLTALEYAGYIRFNDSGSVKTWYPVTKDGVVQKYNPKHPYFVAQREAQKQAQLPEMKYHLTLAKTMDRIVKLDFTGAEKIELHDLLMQEAYAQVLQWRELGYTSIAIGAKFCLEGCQLVNEKIDTMLKEKGQFESDIAE